MMLSLNRDEMGVSDVPAPRDEYTMYVLGYVPPVAGPTRVSFGYMASRTEP
jgi:hypothetical protein